MNSAPSLLPIFIVAFCLIAGVLLVMLTLRVVQLSREQSLRRHHSKDESLADLLNYSAVVDDGIIVCKNGSFITAWLYKGNDNASSTEEERNIVSARINSALDGYGTGMMLHIDAVRRPAPEYPEPAASVFGDKITRGIDEERRRHFESLGTMYEGYFVITLTWFPPLLAQRKFVEMFFDDGAMEEGRTARTEQLVQQFKRERTNLETRLGQALALIRLGAHKQTSEDGAEYTVDDLLSWLHFCVTGIHQPIRLPSSPMYIDALIGGQELYGGVVPKLGRKFIQTVAVEGLPMESTPGILSALAELSIEYRWSSRFIFIDRHESIALLEKYRKKWRQKIRGFFDQIFNTNRGALNQDAISMTQDAEDAIADIETGTVAPGFFTSVIVLMHEDREQLDHYARSVQKVIERIGFAARVETINTLDAFFGSLPGHGVENVRRPHMHSMNLADLIPTSSIWTGSVVAPCPMYPAGAPALMHCVTAGATPFRLNLHVRDVGHTLIIGPTGSGKSTKLAMLAAQFRRYAGTSVYCFDKGMSMFPLAAAIHADTNGQAGHHYAIGDDGDTLAFCPLQYLETKADRAWAMEWIDTILLLNGLATSAEQRNAIAHAILSMHDSKSKTLSEFWLTVQDSSIRAALTQYIDGGAMGHLLDADSDSLELSDFSVFEIEELMNLGDKYAIPVLLYLFRRIERSLHGQPGVIILDEAWLMLGHHVFREKIREWLKVLRKANCLVILATQSLSDAAGSGILDVIVESTPTKIFLPNIYARDEETSKLYRRMNLNDRQISILADATPKHHYYYLSEQGRRLYSLALGPFAMAFVGSSDKEKVAQIKELQKKLGNGWVNEWLRLRGATPME